MRRRCFAFTCFAHRTFVRYLSCPRVRVDRRLARSPWVSQSTSMGSASSFVGTPSWIGKPTPYISCPRVRVDRRLARSSKAMGIPIYFYWIRFLLPRDAFLDEWADTVSIAASKAMDIPNYFFRSASSFVRPFSWMSRLTSPSSQCTGSNGSPSKVQYQRSLPPSAY